MASEQPPAGDTFVASFAGPDRNLGLCALGVSVLTGWNVGSQIDGGDWTRHSFKITSEASFGLIMLAIAILLLWSAVFIRRHEGEPRRFWTALERRHSGQVFLFAYAAAVVLPVACLMLWAAGVRVAVAALLPPTCLAVFASVARLTGGIHPLPEE